MPIYVVGRSGFASSCAGACSAVTMSDRKYYAMDGDITVDISGGNFKSFEVSAYQTGVGLPQVLRGNFTVNIEEDATFASGTVIDATQVKAYIGADKKATLTYPASANLTPKRFDEVNGTPMIYEEPLRIACIGDSITQGNGAWDLETKSYPARLLSLIEESGKEAILGNYSVGGTCVMPTNSIWYNNMLEYPLTREECDADYYIIGIDTNDAYNTMVTDGQHERFEEMYIAFVKGYGDLATTKKVFATSTLYRSVSAGNRRQSVLSAVNVRAIQRRVIETLAKTSDKYVFVDLYALTFAEAIEVDSKGASGALLSGDMLHPHAAGYRNVYAPAIYNAIFNGKTDMDGFSTLETVYVSDAGRIDGAGTVDDPIKYIEVAIARLRPDCNAEIRVLGTQTVSTWLTAPDDLKSIKIVGDGSDATLALDSFGKMIRFRTDAAIDNLKLDYTGTGTLFVTCNYHNIEITDSVTSTVNCVLVAGHAVYGGIEVYSAAFTDTYCFDSVAAGSSNADVTLSGDGQSGVCGANYNTGCTKITVAVPIRGALRDYAAVKVEAGTVYDCTKNTGNVGTARAVLTA